MINSTKQFLSILLILTAGIKAYSQENKFSIGVEGGTGLISLRGNSLLESHKPAFGFSGGVSLEYDLNNTLSLRTTIAFERKGDMLKGTLIDNDGNIIGTATMHSNFNYLTLPLLVRASLGKNHRFFVNAGPYVGYLLKQTVSSKGVGLEQKVDNTLLDKRMDAGITAGVGFRFFFGAKCDFSIEARDNLGLMNVSAVPVYGGGSIKTNSANLLVGFTYKLG